MSRGEDEELRASTTAVDGAADAPALAAELAQRASLSDCSAPRADAASPDFPDFTDAETPPALRGMWREPDSSDVHVRGASYLDDQRKVPAGASVARLLHFDAWTSATPEARHHITRFDLARDGERSVVRWCAAHRPDALVFVLNIELPAADNVSLVSYWLVPKAADDEDAENATFHRLLRRFVDEEPFDESEDEHSFRNRRFKMIPAFTQAPWVLNQLVQSRPALTGKKLTQRYFRGDNYVEVAMDISSSTVAHYIGSLCQSWASYIEVDVFITVQGEQADELPEKILGGVRLQYVDLALARRIDGSGDHAEDEDSEERDDE